MNARRITAIAILGAFLALAVTSFLGNWILSAVFIVVAGAVLVRHAAGLCPRCSNLACAFNPRAAEQSPSGAAPDDGSAGPYSDLEITRTTVVPLLIAGPLAVVAAWQFNPVVTVIIAAWALSAHTVFRHLTCRRCGNDCAGNCNPLYREWRAVRSGQGT